MLFTAIQYPIKPILLAHDLSIHMQTESTLRAHRTLQKWIDAVLAWLSQYGFRSSPSETSYIIFRKRKSQVTLPPLVLNGNSIPVSEIIKYLVLCFHSRHSRLPHVNEVKAKCRRVMNVLKYLSHSKTGCNHKFLFSLYQALMHSRLDHGVPISLHNNYKFSENSWDGSVSFIMCFQR